MLGNRMAIDLGTANLRIYRNQHGILIEEPAIVAVEFSSGALIAFGQKAYDMIGKTGNSVAVVGPMRRGTISDFYMAETLVRHYLRQIRESHLFMPKAVVTIPSVLNQVEKRSLIDVLYSAGVRKISLIESAMATAIGAGLAVEEARGRLVVNVGGGCTDVAVLSLGGISSCRTLRAGGDDFDAELMKYLRRHYNLVVGKKTAELTKMHIGCVYPTQRLHTYRVKGQHGHTGLPLWRDVTSDEVLEALLPVGLKIARTIYQVLEDVPPDMLSDILEDGITLAGGSAHLYGLDTLIAHKTGLKVVIPPVPEQCAILGAGISLPYLDHRGSHGVNPLKDAE